MAGEKPVAFRGIFSLLLTPFQSDGAVDWPAYERYVAWHAEQGADGLFTVCGSGEMTRLDLPERLELARRAAAIAHPLPVVATANLDADPQQHDAEVRRMADMGVAGVVLVPRPGLGTDPERIFAYYDGLAHASPVPVVLYEWPGVQPHLVPPDVFGRLARRGVVGLKDTSCTREGIRAKAGAAPSATLFQACTQLLRDTIPLGVRGVMAITTTAFPDLVVRFWRAAQKDLSSDETLEPNVRMVALDSLLGDGYPASAKYLARRRGVPMELYCRSGAVLSQKAEAGLSAAYGWLCEGSRT